MNITDLQKLDLHLNWHPCSQMKDYELFKPLIIKKAYDCYLELSNGTKIIDAISSWWCKSLGHQHPQLLGVPKRAIEPCREFRGRRDNLDWSKRKKDLKA